jgi:CheY-like chemotaxis protein
VPNEGCDFEQDLGDGLTGSLGKLAGLRVLVVEDETLIAMPVEDLLADMGCTVVAVAATISQGLAFLSLPESQIDGAILDINLGGEKVFPIADMLIEQGIPFAFATGYGTAGLEPLYAGRPVIAKPFGFDSLQKALIAAWT